MLLLAAVPVFAQEALPVPPVVSTFSISVRVVAVDALVRGRDGELLHHLTKDDFTLTQDGKPQTIRYFAEDSDLPLTVGLMIDTSGSQRPYFDEQVIASRLFLRDMLTRKGDNAFVVRFDSNVLLLQRLTSEFLPLALALGKLKMVFPPRKGPPAGTLLYDSICGTAHNAFGTKEGRRAVVILTDGDDNGSTMNRDQAAACAQHAGVAVYTALYSPEDPGPSESDDPRVIVAANKRLTGRSTMERISRATGGRVFVVSKRQPIDRIYAMVEEDLRNQYRLGYNPPPSAPGSYHVLELKARDKHAKVQARIGYYTPAASPPAAGASNTQMNPGTR